MRLIFFLEMTLSPGRESGFEAFFAFYLTPFVTERFTGVKVPCILLLFPLKRVCREVLFFFGSPLLLMEGAIGAAVAVGAVASTGAISRGLMPDV